MRRRHVGILLFVMVCLVVVWCVLASDEIGRPAQLKQRLDKIESIRAVFGEHVREGVYWKDDEGMHLWTPTKKGDRSFSYLETGGVVCTVTPNAACSSQAECEAKTDEMCADAGHCGVNTATVEVIVGISDDSCSGECTCNCTATGCPTAFVLCAKTA